VAKRRQITQDEKEEVLKKQGLKCFIDGHPVGSADEFEYDHVWPYSEGGPSEVENIAAVCKKHNREKGTLSLGEFRDRLQLRAFFEGAKKRRLDDLLTDRVGKNGFGNPLHIELNDNRAKLYLDGTGPTEVPLTTDTATGERYFYAVLPVSVIKNDAELQPRALEPERLWQLYRHLRQHTQLAPAVCRLVGNDVLLFDGQHKTAAQVWAGRKAFDCKVYIDPDVRRIKETNLSAHDKLRQMPFYTSTLLEKYAGMASEDWEEFLLASGPKTEAAFVDFMRAKSDLSKAEARKRVRSLIVTDILDHPANKLREYITEENRGRQNPLTMARLQKTFFLEFIAPVPLNDEFETESYHRDEERENVVRVLNAITERSLDGRWAPDRNDAAHKKAARLYSAGALRAWVPFLKDAIAPALQLFDTEDRARLFYRPLDEAQFVVVGTLLDRLFSHKVWEDPDPELKDLRYDNADRAKEMLRSSGLTPTWLLGAET
jgi:hypothetical protein